MPTSLLVVLGIGVFAALATAPAQAQTPPLCGKSAVFFINGVNGSHDDAQLAQKVLRNRLKQANVTQPADWTRDVKVYVAYNPSNGLDEDLLEAAAQSVNFDYVRLWRILKGLEPLALFQLPDLAALLESLIYYERADEATLRDHVGLFKDAIAAGYNVVLVPHSQGNFFANAAAPKLSAAEQQSVSIVPVASPTTASPFQIRSAFGSLHTTFTTDLVIKLIRATGRQTLPPNAGITRSKDTFWNHSFVDAYMWDDRTGINIASIVAYARFATPAPAACAN